MVAADLADLARFTTRETRSCGLYGIGCSGASVMISAKNPYTQFKALAGRAFRTSTAVPYGPAPGIYDWLERFVPVLLPDFTASKMTVEDWLQSMPSRRKRALTRAWEDYKRTGWQKHYETFKAFIKKEKLPNFDKDGVELTILTSMLDRLIQGPADATHVIAGPYLKPLLSTLKERWHKDAPIFYGSVEPEKLHCYLQRLAKRSGTYFWCDYKMFDNTHSAGSWDFMERRYRACYGDCTNDFWRVMDTWRRPRGKIGAFRYQARVMNASGRDDTALANGVLNGFAAYLSACAAYLNQPLLTLTPAQVSGLSDTIIISVCGDDSIGNIPIQGKAELDQFLQKMSDNIAMFGFEAKLNASQHLMDAVYLGCRPYPTRAGWFWGKTIGRSTYKMGWVIDDACADPMAIMTGVAEMHTICSRQVPVLYDLAKRIVELRRGAKVTRVNIDDNKPWEWTHSIPEAEYDDLTLQSVVDMFNRKPSPHNADGKDSGLTLHNLKELIYEIRTIPCLPYVLNSSTWRRIIHMDDL